jgi:hypothetical protein
MNPPDAPPAGDPESVRTARPDRRSAPEQRPAPPEESSAGARDDSRDPVPGNDPPATALPDAPAAVEEPAPPVSTVGKPAGAGLTERELAILAFERQWWKHAGAKEQTIRDTFGLSATRYYQLLNNLLDNPAALAAEPQIVGRLRRLRATRSRNRRR